MMCLLFGKKIKDVASNYTIIGKKGEVKRNYVTEKNELYSGKYS